MMFLVPSLFDARNSIIEKIQCEAKGGEMYRHDEIYLRCALPTTDGGMSCTDSDQCENYCKPIFVTQQNGVCENSTKQYGNRCYEKNGMCSDTTGFPNGGWAMREGKIIPIP